METQFISPNSWKSTTYLAWILISSSIFSCSARADFNIIIVFLFLYVRSQYTNDKFKILIRATIQIIVLSLFFDIICVWKYSKYWKHGNETSELWKSLSFIHNFSYYLGILEFLLKFPVVISLYKKFIGEGGNKNELISLNYSSSKL